jgi:hypothetical protein
MSDPILPAKPLGAGADDHTQEKSRASDTALRIKRARRLESIAARPTSNAPGAPPDVADTAKEDPPVAETGDASALDQIRRWQAGQQSDAGRALYQDGDIFRGRPLLTLKKGDGKP